MHTLWILFALRLFSAGSFLFETPQLWADIANDKHIGDGTRRIAVIRMADRHARPGMTFTAFCSLFDNPNWLSKEDFTNWNKAVLAGYIPVGIDDENSTTFCFRVFPDLPGDTYAVYFRVSGQMDVDTLWQFFHGANDERFNKAKILEVAASAGRDNLCWQIIKAAATPYVPVR